MLRSLRLSAILIFLVSFCPDLSFAQVATGTPPFGSYAGSPDTINLGNLNVHWTYSVLSKPGRGLNFDYYLGYDSSVWSPVTSGSTTTWQPTTNWGWTSSAFNIGEITTVETSVSAICDSRHGPVHYVAYYWKNWAYIDAFGTPHRFVGTSSSASSSCGTSITGFTATASDGSGYTITVRAGVVVSLHASNGTLINTQVNNGTGANSAVDRNGNEITYSSSSAAFTDTLNVTALTVTGSSPNPVTYTYPLPSGASASFVVKFSTYSVQTNFGCTGVTDYGTNGTTTASFVSEIDLPDYNVNPSHKYTFNYEKTPGKSGFITGRLASVMLPTGGTVSYIYTGGPVVGGVQTGIVCSDGSAAGLQRTTSDGTWTYTRLTGSGSSTETTVTAPQLSYDSAANQTIMQFQGIYETQRDVYQGAGPTISALPIAESTLQTSNLKQEIQTCYNGSASPCPSTAITLPILSRLATTQLDSGPQSAVGNTFNTYGLPTEIDEYGYGSQNGQTGSIFRKTVISYASLGNNINASQQTVQVYDGSNNLASQTTYNYDETATTAASGTPQHVAVSGARGNTTTIQFSVTGSTTLNKKYSYYDTGNVNVATDFAGANTTYTYGDCGNSFATQQTTTAGSLSLTNAMTWDCNGGVLLTTTDTNNQQTSYLYDSFWRPTQITRPDSVQLTYQYPTSASPTYVVTTPIQGTSKSISTTTIDGLGRPTEVAISDASGTTYSLQDTVYDSQGGVYEVSNPYAPNGTKYWTISRYDSLGRLVKQVQPDNSNQISSSYSGFTVTITDEAGKQVKYDYDAPGRILNAYEPDPTNGNALTVETSYTYTPLDKISTVTEGLQSRSYNYDLMGRTTSVTTPESGLVTFQFNLAGLTSQRSDARGVQTNYVYDGLSRLIGQNYIIPNGSLVSAMPLVCDPSGNPTPSQNVCFFYDQGGASANALGRLTKAVDPSGSESYTFDKLGRTTQVSKIVGTAAYNTSYQYDLANQVTSITYPSGTRVVQKNYDSLGRLCSIGASGSSCTGGTLYSSGLTYSPSGQLTGLTYGNGVVGTFGYYPDRLQLQSVNYTMSSTALAGLQYWYHNDGTNCPTGASGNNGQIQCINDSVDSGRNIAYTYDALSRLIRASTQGSTSFPQWGLSWSYDRYGNRISESVSSGCVGVTCPQNSLSFSSSGGALTNRQDSMCFDASGNLLAETPAPCPSPTYTYDGENRMTGYQTALYTVDKSGMRVKKQIGGSSTVYIFAGSNVLAEYDNGAAPSSPSREYIYSGSGLLAKIEGGVTNYYHNDHLSARVLTDSAGNVLGQRGHFPFGETWYENGTTTTKWKFTSYERDSESTNDYARMRSFVNRFGRFSSPDPINGGLNDPQSLNRYAYVRNDPCNRVDPLGLKNTCTLNLNLTNNSGANLDLQAVANRISDILARTMSPDGNQVNVTIQFQGNADYTINLTYAGAIDSLTYGAEGNYGFTIPFGQSYVYVSNISLLTNILPGPLPIETAVGSVSAHELGHQIAPWYLQFAGLADIRYNPANPNIMMIDDAGGAGGAAIFTPNSPLWQYTPQQIDKLYKKCIGKYALKHPNPPKTQTGGGGSHPSVPTSGSSVLPCEVFSWTWTSWDAGTGYWDCTIDNAAY
jgi:RHS repeat-associated protein